jgi:ribosomal protein L1
LSRSGHSTTRIGGADSEKGFQKPIYVAATAKLCTLRRFLNETNQMPKPFTWTADPNKIIAAVKRGHQVLDSIHQIGELLP